MCGKVALVLCFAAVAIWTSDILDDEFHDETASHQLEAVLKEQDVPRFSSSSGFLRRLSLPGNAQLAKEMVAKSGRRNFQNTPLPVRVLWSGDTPLHKAARIGDVSEVKKLLAKGAEVNAETSDGWTPLHEAASKGHLNVVKALLAKGAAVNAKNNYGKTPLHKAAMNGHLDVVKALLANGAEVDAKDGYYGYTPVNVKGGYYRYTPLHEAASKGHLDVVKALIAKGAKVDAKTSDGWTPLHEAASKGHLNVVKALLANGAEVDAKNKYGYTPLHEAVRYGHVNVVKALLANGAEVDAKDEDGQTPLHEAASKGHLDVVKALIAKGAEVDAKTSDGWTPLHEAASTGHLNVVKALLAKGAEVNAKTKYGSTPLDLAASKGHEDVVQALGQPVIKLLQRAMQPKESSEALKILSDVLQVRCLPKVAQWAVNNSYGADVFPGEASVARSCVLQYMSFEAQARLAAKSWWSYVTPIVGVAIAAASVYMVEPLILRRFGSVDASYHPLHEEGQKFYHGAHLLVAKAAIKRSYHDKLAFRLVEVMSVIAFFMGFAMVELWWVLWLPFVGLLFLLPGIKLYGRKELMRAPVLCIASTNTGKGDMLSLLRVVLIFGAYKSVEITTGWQRGETIGWMQMFVNPMYEGLQNKMKYMWPEATLASLLGISALNISELGKWVLFVSLSAYACILLLRKVDGDAPDINYVSYAKELAECPTEDVPGLIEEIKQKEPDLQVEPIGKCSLAFKLLFVALDVFFDVNTIITLILSSNLRFACALTFVVARSTFREWNNFSGLKEAVEESYERGMLHEQLIDLLEEEKGAEAFFSLSITSYSYVYCVQTAEQAMLQWCSILMAAYGIAEFLVQKMDFPTAEKFNSSVSETESESERSFVIVPSEEIRKEKGDA